MLSSILVILLKYLSFFDSLAKNVRCSLSRKASVAWYKIFKFPLMTKTVEIYKKNGKKTRKRLPFPSVPLCRSKFFCLKQ